MTGNWLTLTDCVSSLTYFNFSLSVLLKSCHRSTDIEKEEDFDQEEDVDSYDDSDDGVFDGVSSWFGLGPWSDDSDTNTASQDEWFSEDCMSDNCVDVINSSLDVSASVSTLLQIFLALLLAVLALPLITRVAKRLRKLDTNTKKTEINPLKQAAPEQTPDTDAAGDMRVEPKTEGVEDDSQTLGKEIHESNNMIPTKSQMPVVIPSPGCNSLRMSPNIMGKSDAVHLLVNTVDHFLSELDRVLGVTAAETSPLGESLPAFASSSTPRPERKGSVRRSRWRSPHSLPLGAASLSPDDKQGVRMWQKVEDMAQRMRWSEACIGDLDISVVQDNRLSAVLQFYQQICPVRTEQHSGSCLIVNYVLSLLEQELLAGSGLNDPLKLLELRSFGSAASKTCISRMDRFNVMLVLQMPSCREMSVFHWGMWDELPAGRLVLGVKEHTVVGTSAAHQLLMKDRVCDSFGLFLSHREVIRQTQKMLSGALERLRSKNKGALDRLPFTLRLSPYEDLLLHIDTKLLNGMGLGLSEITIRFTPSICVSSADCEPLPTLYAVPPWGVSTSSDDSSISRHRLQARIMRNRSPGVPPDLLWQLNCSEMTKSFMAMADRRLASAGVWGCQVMCQQILRALFSRSGKDTLLTSGELHPHILDTIVCFLLLESPAASWDISSLPDRLSDCVLFLRSAVQSVWMPGFILHNPHLKKQMPALKLMPLLNMERQENLLSNVGTDAADTIQAYMDTRLQETGLRRCLKSEYSSEMWEYEFFIFG